MNNQERTYVTLLFLKQNYEEFKNIDDALQWKMFCITPSITVHTEYFAQRYKVSKYKFTSDLTPETVNLLKERLARWAQMLVSPHVEHPKTVENITGYVNPLLKDRPETLPDTDFIIAEFVHVFDELRTKLMFLMDYIDHEETTNEY